MDGERSEPEEKFHPSLIKNLKTTFRSSIGGDACNVEIGKKEK
jgi:hypothetical protein